MILLDNTHRKLLFLCLLRVRFYVANVPMLIAKIAKIWYNLK